VAKLLALIQQSFRGAAVRKGIGFAIPSNTVRSALESLLKNGRIIRGYLGIVSRNLGPGAKQTDGVVVDDVYPDSPADEAQMKRGDVIRKFNGHDIKTFNELRTLISQAELNKQVEIEVNRNGQVLKLTTALKEQPVDFKTARINPREPPQSPNNQIPPDESEDQPDEASVLGSIEVGELTSEAMQRPRPSEERSRRSCDKGE
jgi:membrane-associated protease RseP (regulator of RpoE activity)